VGKHDPNKVAGCKSFEPTLPGDLDLIQQFRGDRRCDTAGFFEQVPACGVPKATDKVQAFEERRPRLRDIPGGLSASNAQERGRTYRGIGLLSLPPRTPQKIV
jgi:hypothetical protein